MLTRIVLDTQLFGQILQPKADLERTQPYTSALRRVPLFMLQDGTLILARSTSQGVLSRIVLLCSTKVGAHGLGEL